jgi:hypothetical protein
MDIPEGLSFYLFQTGNCPYLHSLSRVHLRDGESRDRIAWFRPGRRVTQQAKSIVFDRQHEFAGLRVRAKLKHFV